MVVVIAIHEIEDVAGFWGAVRSSFPRCPTARLDALYPLVNGSRAVSVWDGLSADAVGDFLDTRLCDFGSSELYEVDPRAARARADDT
jgi:hypothetical protein